MARASWIGDDDLPALSEQVEKLEHFTNSLADGVVGVVDAAAVVAGGSVGAGGVFSGG